MSELTQKEEAAIKTLERAMIAIPKTLQLYVLDGKIVICKEGISSRKFNHTIARKVAETVALDEARSEDGGVDMY